MNLMERIEDLGLMVSEAKKMAETFKAFEKIPRILSLLQSSSKMMKDMGGAEKQKQADLEKLDQVITVKMDQVKTVAAKVKEAEDDLADIKKTVATEKAALLNKAKVEVAKKQATMEDRVNAKMQGLEVKVSVAKKVLDGLQKEATLSRATHEAKLLEYATVEADAKARAEDAENNLKKIKQSLFGGVE
jgi:hypothetical protein